METELLLLYSLLLWAAGAWGGTASVWRPGRGNPGDFYSDLILCPYVSLVTVRIYYGIVSE